MIDDHQATVGNRLSLDEDSQPLLSPLLFLVGTLHAMRAVRASSGVALRALHRESIEGEAMNSIELSRKVLAEHSCCVARYIGKGQHEVQTWGEGEYEPGWFLVDAQTANVVLLVYDALSDENKRKVERIDIVRLAGIAWRSVVDS